MTDDSPLDDYLQDGRSPSASEGGHADDPLPPLKVLDETTYLDDALGSLLLEIYDRGRVTVAALAEAVDRPVSRVNRQVAELRKQGYLAVEYHDGEKFYTVSPDWGTQEFPSGPIIPLVYQYNLLSDSQRMAALKTAIEDTVQPGDVVADLGAGVGVLSYLAAETADQVYAVELDREVYETGREITRDAGLENVEYIRGDAREIALPEPVDVVMCELLDTALVAELQVPVMNHAVEHLLATDGRVIPTRARTSMQLVESDYTFFGGEFRLPHFEEYGSRESEVRSAPIVYHDVSFAERNPELVEERVTLAASEPGVVNGVQLHTDVKFGAETVFTGSSPWLDPPLTLPFDADRTLEAGDALTVEISYELGGGLSNIVYDVVDDPDDA